MKKPDDKRIQIRTGLIFTSDQMPGYRRLRRGRGFSFLRPDGTPLLDIKERSRIRSLAIPPAYEKVWICTLPNGHLQATGVDAKGRKQYRYHPAWHESTADKKFETILSFAQALPKIRQRIRSALLSDELDRERVVAGIAALLDSTGYRIGNWRYAKENGTYGLASLLSKHLKEEDGKIVLRFIGKAGIPHNAPIQTPLLIRLIGDLHDLPGQHLFRYEGDDGSWHDVGTTDVNDWLKEAGEGEFTAKQFRTWRATVLCARELSLRPTAETVTGRRAAINEAIKRTASRLHHTTATCRKYYIHPSLFRSYEDGSLYRIMNSRAPSLRKSDGTSRLGAEERRVYKMLSAAKVDRIKGGGMQDIRRVLQQSLRRK